MTSNRRKLRQSLPKDRRSIEDWLAHPLTEQFALALAAELEEAINLRSDGWAFVEGDPQATYDRNKELGLRIQFGSSVLKQLKDIDTAEYYINGEWLEEDDDE